jgi:hypothetical protein
MLLHVRVTADPDEPLTIDASEAEAGYTWLMDRWADGDLIDEPRAFEQTGGYMNVRVSAEDRPTALRQLDDLLSTYPLLKTITIQVDVLTPTLRAGFEKLLAAIDRRERIAP